MNNLIRHTCGQCGVEFGLTEETLRALRQSSATFYCPYGHARHFPQGPSREDVLRQERDSLRQQASRYLDQITEERNAREKEQRRAAAARGQVTRLKNRAKAGLCPCCNRHFTNLERHMASRHPEAEPVAFAEEQ